MDKQLKETLEALIHAENLISKLTTKLYESTKEIVRKDIGFPVHLVSGPDVVLKVWRSDGYTADFEECDITASAEDIPAHECAVIYSLRKATYELKEELLATIPVGDYLVNDQIVHVESHVKYNDSEGASYGLGKSVSFSSVVLG